MEYRQGNGCNEYPGMVTIVNEEVPDDVEDGYNDVEDGYNDVEDCIITAVYVPVQQLGIKRGRGWSDEENGQDFVNTAPVLQAGKKRGRGWPGKRIRDPNEPNKPTTAYLLFCKQLRVANQNKIFTSSELGEQWRQLDKEERQRFNLEAKKDRKRYFKEFEDYQKSGAYQKVMEGKYLDADAPPHVCAQYGRSLTPEEEKNGHTCVRKTQVITSYNERNNQVPGTEIPIFTSEFLAHRKELSMKEQNALLSEHNDKLKDTLERLNQEIKEKYSRNEQLRKYLMDLKKMLTKAFEEIALPDSYKKPTLENIDSYMLKLQLMVPNGTQEHQQLIQDIKAIMKRLQTSLANGAITPMGNNAHMSS